VFKNPNPSVEDPNAHIASKIMEEDTSDEKVENVVAAPVSPQRPATALHHTSQSDQPDGIMHASTKKLSKAKNESKFANVSEGVSHGEPGQRRHRRSSGFLSLLG
jgi:hypothetical protein